MNTRAKGTIGETYAIAYLEGKGYRILSCNKFEKHEEIDIVAETEGERVFIEVKARTYSPKNLARFGTPRNAVTPSKRVHLLSCARKFNLSHKTDKPYRFDIIEVFLSAGDPPEVIDIYHMEDAIRA